MAGLGSRFASAIIKHQTINDVAGKPMIVRVMENLSQPGATFTLLARKEHIDSNKSLSLKYSQTLMLYLSLLISLQGHCLHSLFGLILIPVRKWLLPIRSNY
jgi:hypothetical protein